MRLVLDTNVIVAALRSGSGASSEILRLIRNQEIELIGSHSLALEYAEVCSRPEHRIASGLTDAGVAEFVLGVCAMMQVHSRYWSYRPILKDPADEMVLEAAIKGRAYGIVTFNHRDFFGAQMFGINILSPSDVLKRIS